MFQGLFAPFDKSSTEMGSSGLRGNLFGRTSSLSCRKKSSNAFAFFGPRCSVVGFDVGNGVDDCLDESVADFGGE